MTLVEILPLVTAGCTHKVVIYFYIPSLALLIGNSRQVFMMNAST